MKKTVLLLFCMSCSLLGFSQPLSSADIDRLAERTLKTFDVPGISIGIVKDGKLIHAKGYGIRNLNNGKPMDENTLVGIASNSKAFTAAALGILVDEGKLQWDDKVTDYIPEFKLADAYVTGEFTVRDLLTHRSGLGLGAGDLMIFPGGSDFAQKDIIHNLRYLKAVSSFRSKFDYDNLLYIVAGEVITRITGKSWQEFIETRIMQPLQMTASAADFYRLKDTGNVAAPHAPINGKVRVVTADLNPVMDAAGGIYANITDMSKWVIMQMEDGSYGKGQKLFSKAIQDEMWMPQTIIATKGGGAYNTHFLSYGLGWMLSDVSGYKQVMHTGGLAGMVTQVTLIPELKLGIIVLTNQQSGGAYSAISNQIKDGYLGIKNIDRIKEGKDRADRAQAEADKVVKEIEAGLTAASKDKKQDINTDAYIGTYADNWFGDVLIEKGKDGLRLRSLRSPRLSGNLYYYKGNTFVVKWEDRSMDADAYVMFTLDEAGNAERFAMKAVSPLTDFSYDFQDLDLRRKKK